MILLLSKNTQSLFRLSSMVVKSDRGSLVDFGKIETSVTNVRRSGCSSSAAIDY